MQRVAAKKRCGDHPDASKSANGGKARSVALCVHLYVMQLIAAVLVDLVNQALTSSRDGMVSRTRGSRFHMLPAGVGRPPPGLTVKSWTSIEFLNHSRCG